jgi:nucleotide-binding universal stress UspA family protein
MFHKILVAIDPSEESKYLFNEALAFAKAINAQLLLLHVLSPLNEGSTTALPLGFEGVYPGFHTGAIDSYMEQWQGLEQQGLERLRSLQTDAESAGVVAEFSQNVGEPGQTICDVAKSWDADLIIMGRRGLAGLRELLLGSVSNYVLHRAHCSVLTVQHVGSSPELVSEPIDSRSEVR